MSASKKLKLDSGEAYGASFSQSFLSEVNAEVQLDIALRERLADTLESRIVWASALKESLKNGSGNGGATADGFRRVALDALQAADLPSQFILARDPPPPPLRSSISRPLPRKVVPQTSTGLKPSFLFVRSPALLNGDGDQQRNHLYLLRCPACSRTKFSSLQGLLNHARLTHNLEWGTHDECIKACAVQDNDLDTSCGSEVGLGPMGVLPGLRTLFQMAVNAHTLQENKDPTRDHLMDDTDQPQAMPAVAGHLNRTLGIHEETPALAPFLGKATTRRQIKIAEDDVEVDIMHAVAPRWETSTRRPWRMPFAPRNFSQISTLESEIGSTNSAENDESLAITSIQDVPMPSSTIAQTSVTSQSRFHLVSRIVITDRNLWMPPERRSPEYSRYTHKWMISIDSPSYTHHITTILSSVKVVPSESNASIPTPPIRTGPPFIVIGVADRPFLAKIELSFSGTSSALDQKLIFQHWVDLYPAQVFYTQAPVVMKGEDQVVDIDLDKDTVLKPPQLKYTPIEHRSHWHEAFHEATVEGPILPTPPLSTDEKYKEELVALLERFPMTLRDFKGRRPKASSLPYRLPSSPEQFWTLVMGRRKAIEWGRARAIQGAYEQLRTQPSNSHLIPLSVVDVYVWLSENGHFLKNPRTRQFGKSTEIKQEIIDLMQNQNQDKIPAGNIQPKWCRICGLEMRMHENANTFKKEDLGDLHKAKNSDVKTSLNIFTTEILSSSCPIVPEELQILRLPRLNIQRLSFSSQAPIHVDISPPNFNMENRLLLSAADPSLTSKIHDLTQRWHFRTFLFSATPTDLILTRMPLDYFGTSRKDVEKTLAPHALLAILTQRFIRALVDRGLEVANRDKTIAIGLSSSSSFRKRSRNKTNATSSKESRLLTPTHILSGILTRGRGRGASRDPLDAVLLLFLSRLGVPVEEELVTPTLQEATSGVKLEQEM